MSTSTPLMKMYVYSDKHLCMYIRLDTESNYCIKICTTRELKHFSPFSGEKISSSLYDIHVSTIFLCDIF